MRSICLLVLFVAAASEAVPRGHPEVLKRQLIYTKTGPRVPPSNGNGRDTNGNGRNGNGNGRNGNGNGRNGNGVNGNGWSGIVSNFLQLFRQAPPNVQRQIFSAFSQMMPQSGAQVPPAAGPAAAVPPPAGPAPPPAGQAPPAGQVPPPAGPAAGAAAPPQAGPAMPPTRLKSAPRPTYTYNGKPALFDPRQLYEHVPAGQQYPAPQPPQPADPVIDFFQFYHLFTDAPEVKKNGAYIEYH